MSAIAQDVDIQACVTAAIKLVAADMEAHCRAVGLDHLRRGEEIPEVLWEDMEAALELQGVIGVQG